MIYPDLSRATLQRVEIAELEKYKLEWYVLRLDLIHPVISGNKWFKLKYHLQEFHKHDYKKIITFGGPWSNHIIATAAACRQQHIPCTGMIRGEKPDFLSETLLQAVELGMHLEFISREAYSKKTDPEFLRKITGGQKDIYILPEGGSGEPGEKGSGEIITETDINGYSHIFCSVGTATMFNGIKARIKTGIPRLIGVPALKGFPENDPHLLTGYHFGGYAKYTDELIQFMNDFYLQTGIPTDVVYTGKLHFAIRDLISKYFFQPGDRILSIHSGGLQGNRSLQKGTLIF